jgi:peptidoglycan/LPS O-acetylase OafA/YrhL
VVGILTKRVDSSAKVRSGALDILRAIAILLVLGQHLSPVKLGSARLSTDWGQLSFPLNYILSAIDRGGWTGVDLFFVLSGFLISGLLFEEHRRTGSISFKNFFIRRGFKIYPPYYLMIALAIVIPMLLISGFRAPVWDLLSELVFLQNYVIGAGIWRHEWSLAVEEHFYILLPLLLIAIAGRSQRSPDPFRAIPKIFAVIAISCLCLRIYTIIAFPYSNLLYPTTMRIDSLMFGVVISYCYRFHTSKYKNFALRFRQILLVLGALAFVPAFTRDLGPDTFLPTFGFTLLYIGSGLILVATCGWEPKRNKIVRALCFVGSRSYSIYIWHMPFRSLVALKYFGQTWYSYTISYIVGSLVVGAAMYAIIEIPSLKIRDRLYPGRSPRAPQPGVLASA